MYSESYRDAYFEALKMSRNDHSKLKDAYATAHRIREFEIELYWKRTAYMWAIQAALIGIAMFLRTSGDTTISVSGASILISTSPSTSILMGVLLISSLALTGAVLWSLLIDGAKAWQNNWERHVDILGHELGENLYRVYPAFGDLKRHRGDLYPGPYSVTKINAYIVYTFVAFWFFNAVWAIWDLCSILDTNGGWPFLFAFSCWFGLYGFVLLLVRLQFKGSIFHIGFRMSNPGTQIGGLPNGPNDPMLFVRQDDDKT